MKLKELPVSLFQQFKLSSIPVKKLTTNKEVLPIIVSLTAILPRIEKVHLVIRSILSQSHIPKKIILNLNDKLEKHIPYSLKKLEGEYFEIHFSKMDCPHMKLIPTLLRFPEDTIVTCDDDLLYQKDWSKFLYNEHSQKPNNIITNQSRVISHGKSGKLLPYKQWPTSYDSTVNTKKLLPIGSAGTLYPPKSLHNSVFDQKLFENLSPRADDLWFKAMSLLNNTNSIQAKNMTDTPVPIMGSQKVSLKKQNIGQDKNRDQWIALTQHFDLKLDDH